MIQMKLVALCLGLSATGVCAAKTHQPTAFNLVETAIQADPSHSIDDEVAEEEREVTRLKAEVVKAKEQLHEMKAEMKQAKEAALKAAADAQSVVKIRQHAASGHHSVPRSPTTAKTAARGESAEHGPVANPDSAVASTPKSSQSQRTNNATKANATLNATDKQLNSSRANASQTRNVSAPYGSAKCPCIGFDGLDGETLALIDGKMVKYPADLGGSCTAWDEVMHPQCKSAAQGWCSQPWCYVDPRKCDVGVLPTMTTYLPSARYKNMPLFYSYATCGSKWGREDQVAQMGHGGCRCVGLDNMPGSMALNISGKDVLYPAESGGSCGAWDLTNHPQCSGKSQPEWCKRKWCFVDPCSCSLAQPPKVTTYLDGTMRGKTIYYSYETCGNEDTFTATNEQAACIFEKDKASCSTNSKCLWTGESCLGKELVDKDACLRTAPQEVPAPGQEKNSAMRGSLIVEMLSQIGISYQGKPHWWPCLRCMPEPGYHKPPGIRMR
ncbi:unnamed protein product [Effrenium voratum]|nr:unnamed protein product [Effrenium voratum]